MFSKIQVILIILLTTCLISSSNAARLNGTVYEWSDLEKPFKNVIVEVESNSTKFQYKVLPEGEYSFDLSPGNYIIKAKYYNNNILEFSGEETIRIYDMNETRILDILIFPSMDPEYEYLGDINLTGELDAKEPDLVNYFIIILVVLLIVSIFIYYIRKNKVNVNISGVKDQTTAVPSPPSGKKGTNETELPDDLRELYEIIKKKGGRVTQKDIRKEVIYGEAKVSLMITDLEDRGFVKKIKKGRSNIIIAENKK